MIYRFGNYEYDEIDLEDESQYSDAQLEEVKRIAEKFARDTNILISRKKMEWIDHGKDPAYGLTPDEFKRVCLERDEALGLVDTIKLLLCQ